MKASRDNAVMQLGRPQSLGRIGLALRPGDMTAHWIARPPLLGWVKRLRLSGLSQLSWKFTENKL